MNRPIERQRRGARSARRPHGAAPSNPHRSQPPPDPPWSLVGFGLPKLYRNECFALTCDARVARDPVQRTWSARADPRAYQIAVLLGLHAYAFLWLEFDLGLEQVLVTFASALLVQYPCTRFWKLPRFDPKSACISANSLCLLLRTDLLLLAALAAAISIASKFVIRVNGKHVFNPTNLGLVALLTATDAVWVSPGQWGSVALLAGLMACLGGLVVHRALRSDVALAFALVYAALLFGRSLYLGEPMAIPIHRLQSGALLLFTFFMISDPKTTPDSRPGGRSSARWSPSARGTSSSACIRTNGLLWSLAFWSPLVPLLDRWLPAGATTGPPRAPDWPGSRHGPLSSPLATRAPLTAERILR